MHSLPLLRMVLLTTFENIPLAASMSWHVDDLSREGTCSLRLTNMRGRLSAPRILHAVVLA